MWNKLKAEEKARIMKMAFQSGIYDLPTIRNYYNEFATGGGFDIPPYSITMPEVEEQIADAQEQVARIKEAQESRVPVDKVDYGQRMATRVASTLGGVLQFIPHPVTKALGYALQVPDVIYDVKDFSEDPSVKNATSLALDIVPLAQLSKKVPTNLATTWGVTGILDDATGYPSDLAQNIHNAALTLEEATPVPQLLPSHSIDWANQVTTGNGYGYNPPWPSQYGNNSKADNMWMQQRFLHKGYTEDNPIVLPEVTITAKKKKKKKH